MIVWICVSIPVYLEEIGMVIDIIKLHVEKNMCMLISEKGGSKCIG